MIGDPKPYPEYRPAKGGWLGQIPSHWMVRRMKYVVRETDSRSTSGKEQLLRISQYTGVTQRRVDSFEEPDTRAASLVGYKHVKPEHLVINIMLAWNGSMGVSKFSGIASPAYCVYRFRHDVHPWYFHNLLRSPAYKARIKASSTGVVESRLRLYSNDLGRIEATLPPASEQAAIVRFLDWANGRMERAIRAKRKVIALLNEQKQAIIHRAVTRGLDPSVPLKPSGIPWLGDIPQHWEVRRLKSLCRFVTSGSRGWARYYADAGFVFLRIGNISTTSVDLRLKRMTYVMPPAGAEGERTRAIPDDLLLSITAQIGAVGVVPEALGEAFVNQHTALIRLRLGESVPRWVAYGLLSQFGKDQCRLMTNGGTKIGLTLDDVRCLVVLLPPIEEQATIVNGIERQTGDLDAAISRLEREIELLREYRTRLVADVVTGKLDVREAAMRLPDEAEPAEDDATAADEEEADEAAEAEDMVA